MTDRWTDVQTGGQADRQTDEERGAIHTHTHTQIQRERERKTHTHTHIHAEAYTQSHTDPQKK